MACTVFYLPRIFSASHVYVYVYVVCICLHLQQSSQFQSVTNKCYDDHSAVYHLLEDRLQKHMLKSHSSAAASTIHPPAGGSNSFGNISSSLPVSQPSSIPTQRRSSITTGMGRRETYFTLPLQSSAPTAPILLLSYSPYFSLLCHSLPASILPCLLVRKEVNLVVCFL